MRPRDAGAEARRLAAVPVLQRPLQDHRPGALAQRGLPHSLTGRGGTPSRQRRERNPLSRPFLRPFAIEKRRGSGTTPLFFFPGSEDGLENRPPTSTPPAPRPRVSAKPVPGGNSRLNYFRQT